MAPPRSRWLAWAALLALSAGYWLVVYATQYQAWYGGWTFYEQHAFLAPAPWFWW